MIEDWSKFKGVSRLRYAIVDESVLVLIPEDFIIPENKNIKWCTDEENVKYSAKYGIPR